MAHNHSICVLTALFEAEQICAEKGLRLTNTRRRVLEMVWASHQAVKAYDLIDRFDQEKGTTKPPTIYRALDFLVENGLAHKIESLNAFVGCNHPGGKHQGNFLICGSCEQISEFEENEATSSIELLAKEKGFEISTKTIEIHGICKKCQNSGKT